MKDNKTLYIYQASAGTGKTFTLAAYYISLLMRDESYRSIMAVTFTNKATAEMKDRIMNHLYWIAQGTEESSFIDKVQEFIKEAGRYKLSPTQLKEKAEEAFNRMLIDYDGVQVTTIDSFLQTLMSGMAHTLGNAAGYAVDLDSERAISDAITQLLSTHIDLHDGLTQTLMEYIGERINDESSWDIRTSLKKLAKELFKEAVLESENQDEINFNQTDIQNFRKHVKWPNQPEAKALQKAVSAMPALPEDVSNASYYTGWCKKLADACNGIFPKQKPLEVFIPSATIANVANGEASMFKKGHIDSPIDAILIAHLAKIVDAASNARHAYITWKYTMSNLADMMLLGYIRTQIDTNQAESNSILLAKTANILAEALRPGDADFILEKAGLRYQHILLDEFQDTSTQQWRCFLPLVHEILSNGGTAFIVGDTKQGIYRWRNGDWTIMQGLEKDRLLGAYANLKKLTDNFRCHKEVIDLVDRFNYNDKGVKDGGSVRVRIYPHSSNKKGNYPSHDQAKEQILADMFAQIEALLQSKKVEARDCLILIRVHQESELVIKAFRQLDSNQFPELTKAGITSSDSLLLETSPSVQVVMNALRYCVLRDGVGLHYVVLVTGQEEDKLAEKLDSIDTHMPLNALVERLISICLCKDGMFAGHDLAYLDCLRDKVADYIHGKGGSVADFIRYWDEKMHSESIATTESKQVRIMTIHSSKGLESKQLFIPFCSWKQVDDKKKGMLWLKCAIAPSASDKPLKKIPVSFHSELEDSDYEKEYIVERDAQVRDNNNLLYVALTRAAENLYVWADQEVSISDKNGKKLVEGNIAWLLINKLGLEKDVLNAIVEYSEQEGSGECYVQYPTPWQVYHGDKQDKEEKNPFSFDKAETKEVVSYAENETIEFRESQGEQAEFGTICHDILAEMKTQSDEDTAIRRAIEAGKATANDEDHIREYIDRAWTCPEMCDWFSGNYTLMREQALMTMEDVEYKETGIKEEEAKVYRPDRVMISGNKAIVLDYKFGAWNSHYLYQVRGYMRLMRDLGYTDVKGYIWMAEESRLISIG